MHVSASLSAAFKLLSNPSHRKLQVQCLLLSIIHSIPYIHTTTTKSTHQNQIMFFRSLPALRHRTAQENAHWGHSQQQYSTATASARARSQYRRGGQAVAAVADDDTKSPPAQPTHTTDPGLEAFKALIAERRFMCTQCGKCCTGDGEVWITDEEAGRMAAHLSMPLQRFYQTYTRAYSKVEGFRLLRAKNNAARDCIFLQPDNTCSIHSVRPLQCSTYPWWPDLMSEQDWAWEKANICEGFDHADAPPTDREEAARQLRAATVQDYQRMLARKPSKKQRKAAAKGTAAAATAAQALPAAHEQQSSSSGSNSLGDSSSSSSGDSDQPMSQQSHSHVAHPQESMPLQNGCDEASSSSSSSSSSTSKKATSQQVWQQRLSRLQDLAGLEGAE